MLSLVIIYLAVYLNFSLHPYFKQEEIIAAKVYSLPELPVASLWVEFSFPDLKKKSLQ